MTSEQRIFHWARFGLSSGQDSEGMTEKTRLKEHTPSDACYGEGKGMEDEGEELFSAEEKNKPWWLATLMMSEKTLFGAWDGVFTSCIVNLLGAIVFLRTGWMVAQVGIVNASAMAVISIAVVFSTTLSVIGILSLTNIESGGVYFLISHVLGSRFGGAVGLIYCFGQIVGIALCFVGFGESMTELLQMNNLWVERGFATGALLVLAAINVSGVKSVIKFQVILCLIVGIAFVDFGIGSFLSKDTDSGVTEWSMKTWSENLWLNYTSGYTWFGVFGVFFPSVAGAMAGINMSGDLRSPERDISLGTLTALLLGLIFYLLAIFILGGTVKRDLLRTDSVVMEKVSASGVLLLVGLYTSILSSPLASLYGTPRILQSLAGQHVIPPIKPLSMGKGPNKLPLLSLLVTVVVTFLFLLIGRINVLAPIVSVPFLITYATIDYAYVALAITRGQEEAGETVRSPLWTKASASGGETGAAKADLEALFPPKVTRKKVVTRSTASSESSSPSEHSELATASKTGKPHSHDSLREDCLIGEGAEGVNELTNLTDSQPRKKSDAWFYALASKWLSLIGALLKIALMFAINWIYGLTGILVAFLLYYYIATAAPGAPPGLATHFNIFRYVKHKILHCIGKTTNEYDEIVVAPLHPGVQVKASQLTNENLDFAARSKFHQAKNYGN